MSTKVNQCKNIRGVERPYAIFAGNTPLGYTEYRVVQAKSFGPKARWTVCEKTEAKGNIFQHVDIYAKDMLTLKGLELVYISKEWEVSCTYKEAQKLAT